MPVQTQQVTMKGNPVTLTGDEIKEGSKSPDFKAVGMDLSEITNKQFKGKCLVVVAVPSLDTNVCDCETKKINETAAKFAGRATFVTISMDLPFAQKRWKEANGIKNIELLSDYKDASFGKAYGVLIKELRLLARSVFIIDASGTVRYRQVVPEITEEPDYDDIKKHIEEIIR